MEAGPVPATILRATQFHEFAEMVVDRTIRDGVAQIPPCWCSRSPRPTPPGPSPRPPPGRPRGARPTWPGRGPRTWSTWPAGPWPRAGAG